MSGDEPSTPEDPMTLNERLERLWTRVATLFEKIETLWSRVSWLLRLEASRADHVVQLTTAVDQTRQAIDRQTVSRDRQTEALMQCLQKLNDIHEQREHVRAGLDMLKGEQAKHFTGLEKHLGGFLEAFALQKKTKDAAKQTKQAITDAVATAEKKHVAEVTGAVEEVVKKAVREATGTHKIPSAADLEAEHDPWYARLGFRFIAAPARAQFLFVLVLALTALSVSLLWKLKTHSEEEHRGGHPVDEAPGHHRLTPPSPNPPPPL